MKITQPDKEYKPRELTIEVAKQIALGLSNEPLTDIHQVLDKGMVNQVFIAETGDSKVVIRMNNEPGSLDQFRKEAWCIEQATNHGIPGAKVLSLGSHNEWSFIVQTFLPGTHGADGGVDPAHTSYELGVYARKIHTIPVNGFGDRMDPNTPGHFNGSWDDYINYNINSLDSQDKLLELDVISPEHQRKVRSLFESFKGSTLNFGLNHGDISLKNSIIGSKDVYLIDWGSAEVNVVPHLDLVGIMGWAENSDHPSNIDLGSFLQGYGLSENQFQSIENELRAFALLRDIDKLRWAIDRKPEKIDQFVIRARTSVEKALRT